jgi:hypothetical protein
VSPSSLSNLPAKVSRSRFTRFLKYLKLESPGSIAPFIRKVNVLLEEPESNRLTGDYKLRWLNDSLTILRDNLPGYNSIFLSRLPLQFDGFAKILPLDRLQELSARSCRINSFHDLFTLLVAISDLRRLTLVNVQRRLQVEEPTGINLDGTMLLPQLHSLAVQSCKIVTILQLLAPPPKLRQIDFEIQKPAETLYIGTFLHPVRPNLEDVRLCLSFDPDGM